LVVYFVTKGEPVSSRCHAVLTVIDTFQQRPKGESERAMLKS